MSQEITGSLPDTKLTPEQREVVHKWYAEKMGPAGRGCPMCGHTKFVLLDHLVAPPVTSTSGGTVFGGGSYPHAMLICDNCATVQFVNAVQVGVVAPGEKQ